MNEKLKLIYENYWDEYNKNAEGLNQNNFIASPLLLKVDEEKYNQSDIKIMIFGQETWGWHTFGLGIDKLMNHYEGFMNSSKPYDGYNKSAFWKAFKFFEKELNKKYEKENLYFIWNNISKIGQNDGATGVANEIRNLERTYFSVVKDEVLLLKPDIVIFFTGPNRDGDIKFHFKDVTFKKAFEDKNIREIACVQSIDLPLKSIRLYHPSYFGGFNKNRYKALDYL
ncbi:hypothetical protein [Aliarcobacter butzleri]|uniref:hypothetical protein n=1 Tax=Aliarcobacter butzleri TaxID=28197 RepID=UPI00125F580D|nr:hypothetical protein [Aliarcobacter butzleri]